MTKLFLQRPLIFPRVVALFFTLFILAALLLLAGIQPPPVPNEYSPQVLDRQGRLLRLYTTSDGYWRLRTDPDEVDPAFLAALLACEDSRFFRHPGVDPLALTRAAWQATSAGQVVSGASTLTMQTVRLLHPRPRTLGAKFIEMAEALALERRLSKKEILGLYLGLAPYGGNLQGLAAASLFYFGHGPERLAPSEIALLIALPQSPEQRRPDRRPEAARQARDRVLERLAAAGLLAPDEVRVAADQPVPARRRSAPISAPHLADRLRAQAPGRDRLLSTLDRDLQVRLENLALREQQGLAPGLTLAIIIAQQGSAEVLAHIGSGGFFSRSQLDLARAVRSPGSTLKPFIYGLAFEQGALHPETLIQDRPRVFGDWRPANFDQGFHGEVTAREALHRSLNIPAVAVLSRVGPTRVIARLGEAGIRLRLPRGHGVSGLALALGGVGCTLEDLVTLYGDLARGGEHRPLAWIPEGQGRGGRLLGPVAAWYVDDVLREAPLPPGLTRNRPLRFKTGTSYGFRDAWAIGYDPGYIVGVWVGRPDNGSGLSITGAATAVPILLRAFDFLPQVEEGVRTPPVGVILARNRDLPLGLRRLAGPEALAGDGQSPVISFPLDGSVLPLAPGHDLPLVLKARGGSPPYHWLVNGEPLDPGGRDDQARYLPDGPGQLDITLVDSAGRSDRAEVWIEER